MTTAGSEGSPIGQPSAFLVAECERLDAVRGPLLDLACGRGRHSIWAANRGHHVVAVDRNPAFLESLAAHSTEGGGTIETRLIDLEAEGGPLPISAELPVSDEAGPALPAAGSFAAVFVFRYLHRPLAPWIASLLAPGGLLFYETFTTAQRGLGWGPSRDAFLLAPGELPDLFATLETVVYEEGLSRDEVPAQTARWLGRRP